MENEVQRTEDFSQDLVKFTPYDSVIAQLKEEYSQLTISGVDDKVGYAKVHAARMTVKNKRIEVEKVTKSLTEIGVRRNKAIYAESNRIIGMLEPIENDLSAKEKAIDAEKARLKKEEDERLDRLAQSRAEKLIALGDLAPNYSDLKAMPEELFQSTLARQKEIFDAETIRLAEEERIRKAEREKEEAERAVRAAEQAKLDQERARLAAERAEFERQIDEENRKKKEEQDKKDKEAEVKRLAEIETKRLLQEAENKRQSEQKRLKDAEDKAKRLAEKRERLKPEKQKMLDLKNAFENFTFPEVKQEEFVRCISILKERIKTTVVPLIDGAIKNAENDNP